MNQTASLNSSLLAPISDVARHFGDHSRLFVAFPDRKVVEQLPKVRLLRDWATYSKGDTFRVYSQHGNVALGYATYRCALVNEPMPLHALWGRTIPAEYCAPVVPLKVAVRDARDAARDEALRGHRFVKSRGTFLATSSKEGQCKPAPEADCHEWRGSMREVRALVDEVLASYPEADEVYVGGGFDGSYDGDTLRDFLSGDADYEPWAASWNVAVWRRGEGWLFDN